MHYKSIYELQGKGSSRMLQDMRSLILSTCCSSPHLLPPNLLLPRHPCTWQRRQSTRIVSMAKKPNFVDVDDKKRNDVNNKPLKLRVSNPLLAKAATAIFGLGFIDAGYSGDWSRINVISKEAEDLLKLAAFLVVPFCVLLIYSISQKDEDP